MDCNGHDTDILASNGTERRSSARLQKLKSEKALRVRPEEKEEPENKKNVKVLKKRKVEKANVGSEVVENGDSKPEAELEVPNEKMESVEGGEMVVIAENGTTGVEKSAYARVTETLRTFNKHYLHFVQVSDL